MLVDYAKGLIHSRHDYLGERQKQLPDHSALDMATVSVKQRRAQLGF